MADETTTSTATAETGAAPTAEAGGEDVAAKQWLSNVRTAAGLEDDAKPLAGAKPGEAPQAGGEKPEKPRAVAKPEERPEPEPPKRPSVDEANQKALSRRQQRRLAADTRLRELETENNALRSAFVEAMGDEAPDWMRQRRGTPPAKPEGKAAPAARAEAEDDPMPEFYADPGKWHEWNRRQLQRDIAAGIEPLVAKDRERERLQEEQKAAEAEREARRAELQQFEDEYAATDEGEGFGERLQMFRDAYAFAVNEYLPGIPEPGKLAERLISDFLMKSLAVSEVAGLNPAYVIDRMLSVQDFVSATLGTLRKKPNGAPAEPAQAAKAPPAPRKPAPSPAAKEEVAALTAAAAAPEAHSLGQGTSVSPSSGDDVDAAARNGTLTTDRLRASLKNRGLRGASFRAGILETLAKAERG